MSNKKETIVSNKPDNGNNSSQKELMTDEQQPPKPEALGDLHDFIRAIEETPIPEDLLKEFFSADKYDPDEPKNCPHCGVSLLGDKIPDDIAEHYGGTHWKREIGIYDEALDRTVAFECPDCKERF